MLFLLSAMLSALLGLSGIGVGSVSSEQPAAALVAPPSPPPPGNAGGFPG